MVCHRLRYVACAIAFVLALAALASSGKSSFAQEEGALDRSILDLAEILPLTQSEMFTAIRHTAERYGIRLRPQKPIPCGPAKRDLQFAYFCEYEVARIRVGFWSKGAEDPVLLVSARPFFNGTYSDFVMALSLVIATIDTDLPDDEIQAIAEKLTTAGRSLSGRTTATGKRGFYMARAGRDGLTFMASSVPR